MTFAASASGIGGDHYDDRRVHQEFHFVQDYILMNLMNYQNQMKIQMKIQLKIQMKIQMNYENQMKNQMKIQMKIQMIQLELILDLSR